MCLPLDAAFFFWIKRSKRMKKMTLVKSFRIDKIKNKK